MKVLFSYREILVFFILCFILSFNCGVNNKNINSDMGKINIIPKPTILNVFDGFVDLSEIKNIATENGDSSEIAVAKLIKELLSPIIELPIIKSSSLRPHTIHLTIDEDYPIPIEGYYLSSKGNLVIEIRATSYKGLFYGYQSLRQLCGASLESKLKPKNTFIPKVEIEDKPVFAYRGMHLDVSRHFFDVQFIKTYIDMIALHKMNVFHWHLTDDNGWRIEIDKYPLLMEKSAWRVDRTSEPWKEQSPAFNDELATYGGYYTKREIRDILTHAESRGVMVIPEIEMPGHTSEVFAAYPELSCNGNYIPVQSGSYWPNVDIFCAGKDEVFEFLENVLEEVVELFPGPYIHIGGDEADKLYWKTCEHCQKRIVDENLKDEHELQSWFIKKIEKYLISKKKKMLGWDEILEGGLAKTATVMSWRGMDAGIQSAMSGHDVIMCPTSHCYFDYYQADPESSPAAFGGYTTLKKVYSFNPIPDELKEPYRKHILGAQGNLWTEYVQTPERAQYRVLPRMSALSEVLWTGPEKTSYEDFYTRVLVLQERFDELGWKYAPGSYHVSIQVDPNKTKNRHQISLVSEKPGEVIRYTLDGSDPNKSSMVYGKPIVIDKKTKIKASLFIDEKQKGRISEKTVYFSKAIGKKVTYNTNHSDRYPGVGALTLVDGLTGSTAHNDNYWQGWQEENMDVVIDLEENQNIQTITLGFLESHGSWIFLPLEAILSFSDDGVNFNRVEKINLKDGVQNGSANRVEAKRTSLQVFARFIRIRAINRKLCPDWHPGSGGRTWVFADEIIIE